MYNLFLFIVVLPVSLIFFIFTKKRGDTKERFGIVPDYIFAKDRANDKKCIWMHAASVGETLSLAPVIKLLKNKVKNCEIVVSTMTEAGRDIIKSRIPEIKNYIYIPLDIPFCVKKTVENINPDVFLISETEIWPNLLMALKRNNAKIILINGRISYKSFKLYKLIKIALGKILNNIDCFNMVSTEDADRIIKLGANREKVKVSGHSKFDMAIKKELLNKILSDFGFIKDKKVIVAGSTHEGEEEIILNVYEKIIREIKDVFLIIAPRHLERLSSVEQILREKDVRFIKRSEFLKVGVNSIPNIILLDTIGELSLVYSLSTVSFVGGSLVAIGGHNVMEPAFFEKPVIFGKYTENFKDITKVLIDNEGGIEIKDEDELHFNIKKLLNSNEECNRIGKLAKKTIEEYNATGSTIKNVDEIISFL